MPNQKKGLRIGRYRITPLGMGVFGGLIAVVAAIIVAIVLLTGGSPDAQSDPTLASATRSPEADVASSATPVPTAAPTPTPEPTPRSATIRALGEISMDLELLQSAADLETSTFDFSPMFSEIADVVGDADYTIADVEGTLGDTMGFSATDRAMYTPSALLTALKDSGVDMLFLGNDHAMDGPFSELVATIDNVEAAGLDHIGTNRTSAEKSTPVVKEINDINVGFLAYCQSLSGESEYAEDADALNYGVNLITNSDPYSDAQALRDAGAEVIVAVVNWGDAGSQSITEAQYQMAMILNAAGVDVIIGYNPQTVQPAQLIETTADDGTVNRTLCLCATGSFLTGSREQYFDCGIIFEFTIQEQADGTFAIETPVYIPTYVLRYESDRSTETATVYDYRTLAVGQWTDADAANLPEGMGYSDLQYMATVWAQIQSTMGDSVATVARE